MSDMSQMPAKPPKMKRGLRIVLFASLAMNLLVVGLIVGAVVSHRFGPDHPARFERPGGALTAALSPQDRRAIGKAMHRAFRENRPDRADVRAGYAPVIAALKAQPFDRGAMRDAMEAQTSMMRERAETGRDLLLDRVERMSDVERAEFADRLQDVLTRGPKPRR